MDAQDLPILHFEQMARGTTALKALPAQVLSHSYAYEAFGSWDTIVRYRGRVFRMVFDGRECAYFLDESTVRQPPYSWKSICTIAAKNHDPWKELVEAIAHAAG